MILVSPAVRATQTADALEIGYEVRPALGTSATPEALVREAGWPAGEANVIIVGHQPTLGRLAARLLGHHGDLAVKKGAIWWFSGKRGAAPDSTEAILRAVIGPDFAH